MSFPDSLDSWVRVLTLLPILICSVVGSALTVVKWLQLRRSRMAGNRLLLQLPTLVGGHDYVRALAVAHADGSLAARLVERTLNAADAPRARLAEHVEEAGRQLAREAEHGVGGIGLIATLGPLLGLFGTVVGIVLVFQRLAATEGVVCPSQLAGGIGTALYTTVAGLVVGMCALVSHRVLAASADTAIAGLESLGQALVSLIEGHAS